jgi:hypothetical protein
MNNGIASKFNIGDRVEHNNHGKGTLIAFTCNPTSALVQFDKEVKGCGTDILEISLDCLESED